MKSSLVALILTSVLLLTTCEGQKSRPSDVFRSEYAGLTVLLPCNAVETRKDSYKYVAGERFGYDWMCEINSYRYRIDYGDHNPDTPESVETFLNYSKGDIEVAMKDKVRETKGISIGGKKGYKFLFSDGKATRILAALTANQRGILHIWMIRLDGNDLSESDRKNFDQILDSVKFVDK